MSVSQDQLKFDIRVRGTIKQRLTNLEKYIESIKTLPVIQKPTLEEIEVKCHNYSSIYAEFQEVQLKIETTCDETQLLEHYPERDTFEDRYCKAMTFLKEYMNKLQSSSNNTNHSFTVQASHSDSIHNFMIPKVKIPMFKGDYEHWLEFKQSFSSIINSNTLASNNKFLLLRSSVEGYAKRLIDSAEISDEDPFTCAWNALTDRFDKKRLLVNKHIKGIFNLEPIQKESAKFFRQFLDNVSFNITAIDNLKIPKENLADAFLIYILSNKLDKQSLRDWKESDYDDFPTIDNFLDFLKSKADILEDIQDQHFSTSVPHFHKESHHNHSYNKNIHSTSRIQSVNSTFVKNIKCNLCHKNHLIYNCPDFLKLDITARIATVEELQLCANCLRTGHAKDKCFLGTCKKCQNKHNTLLHIDNHSVNKHTSVSSSSNPTEINHSTFFVKPSFKAHSHDDQILLSTVTFNVTNCNGEMSSCRAILDSGSQTNLITESFVNRLGLPQINTKLSVIGINQTVSNLTKKCNLSIFSKFNDFQTSANFYVIPMISQDIPAQTFAISDWKVPDNIQLSDPQFYNSREVDAIIGASLFWNLITDGKINQGNNMPTIHNTKLGWVISGNIPTVSHKTNPKSICHFTRIVPEDIQLKKFWELEEVKPNYVMSSDDNDCENLFHATTVRNEEGRFVVKLPLKFSPQLLGDSYTTALKQFISLERKFTLNSEFKTQYHSFIQEYISLGHMSKINALPNSSTYFLPHHGVFKASSLTTKLRVVFNGSSPSTSGWSLNDLQFTGPKIQNDIISILLRFRLHTYVVSADIQMMYRQVLVHPDHRQLQLILWRDKVADDISIYQLNTVTYGTTAAPYLAIKCLTQLAISDDVSSAISHIINNDFYVDDLLTGHNDIDILTTRCNLLQERLSSAGFVLRKWNSNDKRVISQLNVKNDSLSILPLGKNECSKTLGIQWDSHSDTLTYSIPPTTNSGPISKRQILSEISQIYDPLGLLSPSIIIAKIIIQKLWSLNLTWDSLIPDEYAIQWNQFRNQLTELNSLAIPRVVVGNHFEIIDIHCFCDASQQAYACCLYVRSRNNISNETKVNLFCAKTKVAPIKTLSIPRLELCAALLGAQFSDIVKSSLNIDVPFYFWSDSQVVLSWLKLQPNLLEVFVANRITKIQNLTLPENWFYVSTKQNPADIASRGILPRDIFNCTLWWLGPQFLTNTDSFEWSQLFYTDKSLPLENIPELKQQVYKLYHVTTNKTQDNFRDLCTKYSSLNKLKRVFTYCLRFIHNTRSKVKLKGLLTATEIESAFIKLLNLAQIDSFKDDITILMSGKQISKQNKLFSLSPFLDSEGVMRVGGRLKCTSLPPDIKHPIVLSSKHPLTHLIFSHTHTTLLHPGPQLLLATVRQRYWPIGGRNLAKHIVHRCIVCFRHNPKPFDVPIGSLPDNRVLPSLPFQNVGLDYAGPFSTKEKKGRGSKILKSYVCVYVCFVTKAIHLELLTDLTTECFMSCFTRFISRRGMPVNVYSDNGTTFKGACSELQALETFLYNNKDNIHQSFTQFNITWHFIPPYAPNFGGLWEAAVKSMKRHLLRTMLNTTLTFEEFVTILTQVEGILNSRPLYTLSSNPNDLEPLTPAHFLIGRPSTQLPYPDLISTPPNRLTNFQHLQQLKQRFWIRFAKEYTSELHQSYKRTNINPESSLEPGVLVLIKHPTNRPYQWPLGRIHQLIPGKDGFHRVAEVTTPRGIIKRAVRHLCPLPFEQSQCSDV